MFKLKIKGNSEIKLDVSGIGIKKKANTIINLQIFKFKKISVEEEEKLNCRKEQNKQKMQWYRGKKRAVELINLHIEQSSKAVAMHVPKCQNFYNSRIVGPSIRNVN